MKEHAQALLPLVRDAKNMAEESLRRKHIRQQRDFDVVECLHSAERTAKGYIMMYSGNNVETPPISIEEIRVEDVPKMFGGALDVERILENILINAVQQIHEFCRDSGKIRDTGKIFVEIFTDNKDKNLPIKVLIHDTGPGIHRRDYDKIFRPLYTTKKEGYGMGLAVVKQIADSIGVKVSVQNSVMLTGTTFLIELPEKANPYYE